MRPFPQEPRPCRFGLLAIFCLFLFASFARGQSAWVVLQTPTTQDLWGISYGHAGSPLFSGFNVTEYIAVGKSGTILQGSDVFGSPAWTAATSPTTAWLTAVTNGASQFIAVGDQGTILQCVDGTTWTVVPSGTTQRLNGVAYGNGTFLAVGEAGTALTSKDGKTWVGSTTGVSGWLRGVVYANNQFVVVGKAGTILTSPDGITFTARTSGTTQDLEAITYDGTQFYAVGQSLTTAVSPDGTTWTSTTNSSYSGTDFRGVAYFNGVHITVGDAADIVEDKGPPSVSGGPNPSAWYSLGIGHATTVAVGASGLIACSAQDGVTPLSFASSSPLQASDGSGPIGGFAPFVGSTVVLSAPLATGSGSIAYAWSLNGSVVGTGPTLTLANVSPTQAGTYSLTVSNPANSISASFVLNLEPGPASVGLVDPGFTPPVLPYPIVCALPLPDGRVYVCTGETPPLINDNNYVGTTYRLLADGTLDPAFTPVDGYWTNLFVQSDGKVLLYSYRFGAPSNRIERINPDGTLDTNFNPDPSLTNSNTAPIELPSGQLFTITYDGALQRYSTSGVLDRTYSAQTVSAVSQRGGVFSGPTPQGGFYVATAPSAGVLRIIRIDSQGNIDPSFAPFAPTGTVNALQVTPSGVAAIWSMGTSGFPRAVLTTVQHVLASGLPDSSYPTMDFTTTYPAAVSVAPDGSVYTTANAYQGYYRQGVQHFGPSGAFDVNYWAELGPNTSEISTLYPLPNGQLLVTGSFTRLNGVNRSGIARLTPDTAPYASRLANLSTRAFAGAGAQSFLSGFVIQNGSKNLLLRAIGPTLASYGVAANTLLSQTSITLFAGPSLVTSNTGWESNANAATIIRTSTQVGAFALPAGSLDSALLTPVAAGSNSIELSGVNSTTGVGLAEIYDTDPAPTSFAAPRLINISTRALAGTADKTLTAGFVIAGTDTRRVLIRAVGPELQNYGVSGTLPDPLLKVYQGSTLIGFGEQNSYAYDGFVGAFAAYQDSYCVMSLAPGAYTAQVTSPSASTGIALVEVYEFP